MTWGRAMGPGLAAGPRRPGARGGGGQQVGEGWHGGPGADGEGRAPTGAGVQALGLPPGCPHLLALGRRRVEAVVGQVAGEDAQLTGDDPPGLAQLRLAGRGQEGPEVAGGKHGTWRGCGCPVAEAGQGHAGDLGQGEPQTSGTENMTLGLLGPCVGAGLVLAPSQPTSQGCGGTRGRLLPW